MMADDKEITNSESTVAGLKSEPDNKMAKQDASSLKDDIKSDSVAPITSSGVVTPSTKGSNEEIAQPNDNDHSTLDDSRKGTESNNGSYIYCMPGCSPYATGPLMGFNSQQAYFTSSYGSEPVPCYSWDSTYASMGSCRPRKVGNSAMPEKAVWAPAGPEKLNGSNAVRTNGNGAKKLTMPTYPHPVNSPRRGYRPAGKFSSFATQKQGLLPHNGSMNRKPNGRMWDHIDRYKKSNWNEEFDALVELTCGPRAQTEMAASDLTVKKEELGLLTVQRDHFNLPDFQTEYLNAKFYVIKSYSEDDIHKSIKYSVWSSTPNGNKKLDAAFREAETTASDSGKRCPVFLFFSVNGSGQFVGLAEMMGHVDFNKDMDFWQVDKWNGFFPVQWHVIKDVPNRELRHIILENNENRSVTHTRDTQEIKLKQGVELLNIFKNYSAKTSLLDDFKFYEIREKSLNTKKMSKPATLRMDFYKDRDFHDNQMTAREMNRDRSFAWTGRNSTPPVTSLINGTNNLSLRGCTTSKANGAKNPRHSSFS